MALFRECNLMIYIGTYVIVFASFLMFLFFPGFFLGTED